MGKYRHLNLLAKTVKSNDDVTTVSTYQTFQ